MRFLSYFDRSRNRSNKARNNFGNENSEWSLNNWKAEFREKAKHAMAKRFSGEKREKEREKEEDEEGESKEGC